MVNAERADAGLNHLLLDDLACQVATEHALDMAKGDFLSHWGRDGRKAYHRYSFAGGIAAVQENVSAAWNIQSVTPTGVQRDLRDMHLKMLNEVPPDDGHRRAILFPHHTHAGFGVALEGRSLRLNELYLARYLSLDQVTRRAKPKSTVVLTGSLINSQHFLHSVDVFYEELPSSRDVDSLRTPRSVSLPDVYVTLRPRAPEGTTYTDGRLGDYEWGRNGKFRVPAKMFKDKPGIYTIVFWIRRIPTDKGFPGAEICVLCE